MDISSTLYDMADEKDITGDMEKETKADGKHAYLILAHTNFNQLRKLVKALDHPRNDIFIHVDAKAKDFDPDMLYGVTKYSPLIILPKRIRVNWGGVSGIRAEYALLKEAIAAGCHDYYHLISGMDLPIKPQNSIHDFFDAHKGKEFFNLWKMRESTKIRFNYYALFPEGELHFLTRILNHIFKGLQMAIGFKRNRDVEFHYGSNWRSITEDFAHYMLEKESWVMRIFRRTTLCDEIYSATLICNSPFKANLYNPEETATNKESNLSHMRLIDWTRGASIRHPWTFVKSDLPMLEKSEHLWARKFDENVDPEIIDMIIEKVKGDSD